MPMTTELAQCHKSLYKSTAQSKEKKTLTSHILQIKNFIHYINTLKYNLCKNNADVITKCIHVDI